MIYIYIYVCVCVCVWDENFSNTTVVGYLQSLEYFLLNYKKKILQIEGVVILSFTAVFDLL